MSSSNPLAREISQVGHKTPLLVTEAIWTRFFGPLLEDSPAIARQVWELDRELDVAINRWFSGSEQSTRPLVLWPLLLDEQGKQQPVCLHAVGNILHHNGKSAILFSLPKESESIAELARCRPLDTKSPSNRTSNRKMPLLKLVAGGQ